MNRWNVNPCHSQINLTQANASPLRLALLSANSLERQNKTNTMLLLQAMDRNGCQFNFSVNTFSLDHSSFHFKSMGLSVRDWVVFKCGAIEFFCPFRIGDRFADALVLPVLQVDSFYLLCKCDGYSSKRHCIRHLSEYVRWFGAPSNWNAMAAERNHQIAKKEGKRDNHSQAPEQMLLQRVRFPYVSAYLTIIHKQNRIPAQYL